MREVAVTGVGIVPFVRRSSHSSGALGAQAVRTALVDAEVQWADAELLVAGAVGEPLGAAGAVLAELPRTGVEAVAVENASASGSSAFAQAWLAVASGAVELAVAVGIGSLEAALAGALAAAGAGQPDLRAVTGGALPPVVFGLIAARRMHDYGEPPEAAARVSVKNFANAAENPVAQRRRRISVDEVLSSPLIADPIRRLHCCPLGTGAAAAVLASAAGASARAVRVRASVTISDRWHPASAFAPDPDVTARACSLARAMSGIGPDELDVVEVHDAFAVEELEYVEAIGLCDPGSAGECVAAGEFDIGGRVAVSPSGGLLARGHPGGATGLAQVAEIVSQLRGEAGARQQPDARTGLAQMIGAGGVGVVHVFSAS